MHTAKAVFTDVHLAFKKPKNKQTENKNTEDNNNSDSGKTIHSHCDFLERSCCPDCGSIHYQEHVEPQTQITSLISAELNEVDTWLHKGYTIKELYAKNATLIKQTTTPTPDTEQTLLQENRIKQFIQTCKQEKRALYDTEVTDASRLNWKLTCTDKTCRYYNEGAAYTAPTLDTEGDPCIECQTDYEETTTVEEA
jgi:DNA repair exonuclease SbcCD ATPase subunit